MKDLTAKDCISLLEENESKIKGKISVIADINKTFHK